MILDRVTGSIATVVSLESTTAPAPAVLFRSSVAFDAATEASEASGDDVLSLSHTATGSNLAAFATIMNADNVASTSMLYDGVSMVEQWDFGLSSKMNAGYSLAGPASGAKTVTSTLAASAADKYLVVVTMTGVDQTTPAGTAATTSHASSNTQSLTVSDAATDDLIVDALVTGWSSQATVGADQTLRHQERVTGNNGLWGQVSTQPGSAGTAMGWTTSNGNPWAYGAIAFKPVAAGGTVGRGRRLGFERNRRVLAY
jgi:hypothetical protein